MCVHARLCACVYALMCVEWVGVCVRVCVCLCTYKDRQQR